MILDSYSIRFQEAKDNRWKDEVGESNFKSFAYELKKCIEMATKCFEYLKDIEGKIPISKPSRKPTADNMEQYKE